MPRALRLTGVLLGGAAGLGILVLMVLSVADIARRQAGLTGLSGVIEWTEVTLVVVVVIGIVSGEVSRTHVRTELLTARLRPTPAAWCRLMGMVIACVIAGWLTYATFQSGFDSFELRELRPGLAEVPIWPAKLAIPLGFAGLTVVFVSRALGQFRVLGRVPRHSSGRTSDDPMTGAGR
ncbi:hypothetical protein GQ85_08200 [Rhodococcus rhodochrous]|nr:hypothetical protein GQ85_08200 [Rhodococcus rhodochrous]